MFKENTLKRILIQRQKFWNCNNFSKKLTQFRDKKLSIIDFQIKALSYSNWATAVLLIINILMKKTVQYYRWIFNDISLYFSMFEDIYLFAYTTLLLFCTRYIYGTIFTELTIQFRLLNNLFQQMQTLDDMIKCVKHHILLNNVAEDMNDIFSVYLLSSYVTTILLATSQLILAVSSNS